MYDLKLLAIELSHSHSAGEPQCPDRLVDDLQGIEE